MWTLLSLATDTHERATVRRVTEREKTITVGRYLLHRKIARGGMATIHIAHLVGDVGFSRIVAAKRMHPELAQDREFVAMFLDEARVASKVHHRNVVPVLDVVTMSDEVILVQDYVHGVPLSWLQKAVFDAGTRIPVAIAVSIASQILAGLHAAHETTDELGTPLQIVHRDVSPQNVMIATDGTARLLDFGVAKAAMAAHITRAGIFKGKIAYAAPEQIRGKATQQSDLYAAAVILWELLVGQRMNPSSQGQTQQIAKILRGALPRVTDMLSEEKAWLGDEWSRLEEIQQVLDQGLATDPMERWATAMDMEVALTAAVTPAPASEVATWVKAVGKEFLDNRDQIIAAEEASWRRLCAEQAAPQPRAATISAELLRNVTTAEQPPIAATEPPVPSLRMPLLQRPAMLIAACALVGVVLAFGIAFLGRDPEPPRREPATAQEPMDHTVARPVETLPVQAPRASEPPRRLGTADRNDAASTPRRLAGPVRDEATTTGPVAPARDEATTAATAASEPSPPSDNASTELAATTRSSDLVPTPSPSTRPTTLTEPVVRPKPAPPRIIAKAAPARPAPKQPIAKKAAPLRVETKPVPRIDPKPAAATSCNPPYYYEGDKKIFKPSCL